MCDLAGALFQHSGKLYSGAAMVPHELTSRDSAERVELQAVSAHAAPSTQGQRAATNFSSRFRKFPVRWLILGLVLITLLVVVLVGALLATGTATKWTVHVFTGKATAGTENSSVLTFIPRSKPGQDMIWFGADGPRDEIPGWLNLTAQLKQVVAGYESGRGQGSDKVTVCSVRRRDFRKVCFFDINTVAPQCTNAQDFGYKRRSPCVFIQFANVTGWNPEPLTPQEASRVLPVALQPLVKPGVILLHCDGDTPADREFIGEVVYSPYQGFRTEYFPYTGQRGYMPPLVAVQFRRPEIGVVIGVRCRLWARNPPPGNTSTDISFYLLVD